ncbi:MAG: HEAT repeat domain-containing protein [Anaerolineae bacterium]|nr:HEAT repeat domain-containing protein [Anaerolineae bacterium]
MTYEPTLDDYIQQLLHGPNPSVRQNAAFILGRQRDMRVIAPLIHAADDIDATVRMRAVEALGAWKNYPEATHAVLRAFTDADEIVRAQAARSLGLMQDASVFDALIPGLRDESVTVRAKTAEALGSLGAVEAVMPLLQTLIEDQDGSVRYFAQESLVQIGGLQSREAVSQAISSYQDNPGILIDLISVLGRLPDMRNRDLLETLLSHSDGDIRAMAQWAIDEMK